MKTRHGAIGKILAKTGVLKTPRFWWCDAYKQFVIHLYIECWYWKKNWENKALAGKPG